MPALIKASIASADMGDFGQDAVESRVGGSSGGQTPRLGLVLSDATCDEN